MTVLAAAFSPILILMASSCCSGPHDPTGGLFLIPAQPYLALVGLLELHSLPALMLAVGLGYGIPVLAIGILVTYIRKSRAS